MGICLALVQIDHEAIVDGALPFVNRAIESGDVAPLRKHLKSLAFEEPPGLVDSLRERVARLREVSAPAFLIEGAERRLVDARRPEPATIDRATLEVLCQLLGGWCRDARTVDLDKAWDLIHWYSDPARRERVDGDWRCQPAGFTASPFDFAIHGHEAYPCDARGNPVIHTAGSPEMSWYNPPAVVAEIAEAVKRVTVDEWPTVDRALLQVTRDARPYLSDSEDRFPYVRAAFDRFADFYLTAAMRRHGVSVEFY